MKFGQLVFIVVILYFFASCASTKIAEQGNVAYANGQYNEALTAYEQYIKSQAGKESKTLDTVYYKAGLACLQLNNADKGRKYLEAAEYNQFEAPLLFASLADIYKGINNLSMELEALENYNAKYPDGEQINAINSRLFDAYVESDQWQKALDLWPSIEAGSNDDLDKLTALFTVYEKLGREKEGNELAVRILNKDPDHLAALEWNAKRYYHLAENRYMSEMTAYQNNRTNKQYKKLLKAWDVIWPHFRKSRDYFLKLYKLDAQPKYAKYLANIYTRMDKKKKAAYYKKLSKE
jgi:hypothetical protein